MAETYSNRIEVFSSELWREIFDYFHGIELWYSFRGLNKKIDSIIDQTSLYFDFKKIGNYTYFLKNILPTINIINVRSLKLNQLNKTQHFFSIYSLGSMVNLCKLSLTHMFSLNDDTFVFWNQLSSLKYLQSLKIKFSDKDGRGNSVEEIEFIIHSIFNKNVCPLLKLFSISTNRTDKTISTIPSLIQTTRISSIKYFSIDQLAFSDLIKLFPALQNVKSFYIQSEFDFEKVSTEQLEHMSTIPIPLLPKCVQLYLSLEDHINFAHIEYLLKHTPNLKDLGLWSGQYHLLNANKWESLLSSQCPQLIKFQLRCVGDDDDNNYERIAKHCGKLCEEKPFWLERNTIFCYTFYANDDFYYTFIKFNTKKRKRPMSWY